MDFEGEDIDNLDNTSGEDEGIFFGRMLLDAIEWELEIDDVDRSKSLSELGATPEHLLSIDTMVSWEMIQYRDYPADLPVGIFEKYQNIPIKELIKKLMRVKVSDILEGSEI